MPVKDPVRDLKDNYYLSMKATGVFLGIVFESHDSLRWIDLINERLSPVYRNKFI